MPVYFFDSSALVKRYGNESGTTWVKSIVTPAAGNLIYLARITGVEVVSAISRRAHNGEITAFDAGHSISEFRWHFMFEYNVIEITPELIESAMVLAQTHVLRGYDAVQLATSLEVNATGATTGVPPAILVSADNALNAAALVEGLIVDNPNYHP